MFTLAKFAPRRERVNMLYSSEVSLSGKRESRHLKGSRRDDGVRSRKCLMCSSEHCRIFVQN